jgi:multiple sugar transport system substrate-binding protein
MGRFIRVALALSLVLVTAASLAQTRDHPPDVTEWIEQVRAEHAGTTISVSMASHPSTEAFRGMVDEFTELTGIRVEWDIISSPSLRPNHMALASAGASPFDVWMVDGFYISEYVSADTLYPIADFTSDPVLTPEWFDYEDILPAYRLAIATVDGEPYAVPTAGESRFIAYRKDLFEEHGIAPPQTTDELLAAATYFAENVPGVHGMVSRARTGAFFASGWLHILYQFSDGWIDQETGEVLAGSQDVIDSLDYWVTLLRTGPPDIASFTHEEASAAFNAGDAALWFDATAIATWLLDPERSEVYDHVGFLPPPEGPKGRFGALAGWNIAVPRLAQNPEAAWAFVVWMTSRYNAQTYLDNGGVLVRTSSLTDPDVAATHPDMFEALLATFDAAEALSSRGLVWIPPTWLAFGVLQVAGEPGNQALLGDLTPEQAAQELALELEDLLGAQ